jgi:hypothetical protein
MRNLTRLLAVLAIVPSVAATTPAQRKLLDVPLTMQGRPEHPTVYIDRHDIERARENRAKHPWAKKLADQLLADAEEWAKKGDDEIIQLIPPADACYAYGFSGCPVCNGTLGSWWGAGGVASLADPGHIRCVNGHRLPDEQHPDPGHGWTDADGKKFYFVGTYNSFVIDTLTTATTRLVHAYALTGDAKYADKAALVLDHLARIYPSSTAGSWDYPSTPPSGRFNRPWYQVARMLIYYTNDYDILLMGNSLDRPSCVEGLTRRQNIEKNLLLNGAKYCYEQSVLHPALNNGVCDYIRGAMVVGVAMGIPQYVAWSVDGPCGIRAMIANNIDRDGQYYETSAGYASHSRYLYGDIAEILHNYSDAAYPQGIKLAADPAFQMLNLLPQTRLRAGTQFPNLGDDAPNLRRIPATQRVERVDLMNLERLRSLSEDPATAMRLVETLSAAYGEQADALRPGVAAGTMPEWMLFHARDVQPAPAAAATQPLKHPLTNESMAESDFFSQKGLAILRAGTGDDARAATLRFGPTLNHGHFDEMNLNVYAFGMDLTYDLGYALASTHTQVGWAKTTASHNTVLVDETPQLKAGRAGGTLKEFVRAPGVTIVRADDPACYASQKVSRYERTVAMIDISPKLSYLVDVFHVAGGQKRDYVFHARATNVKGEGLAFGEPAKGSLAGEEIHWADRLGSDGDVVGVTNKPYWNPPPGNGLGFMLHPRTATPAPDAPWSATWTIDQKVPARLRLTMLPTTRESPQVVQVDGPGLYPNEKYPKATWMLDRRSGAGKSVFASIIEPYGERRGIRSIEPADAHDGFDLAARVVLSDGRIDRLFWSAGGFAVVRCDAGEVPIEATLTGGTKVTVNGVTFAADAPAYAGKIVRVDEDRQVLYVTGTPTPGEFVYVSNPAYAQDSVYRIGSIEPGEGGGSAIHLTPTRLLLGRGHLEADPPDGTTLPNVIPLEYAKSVSRGPSGFFRGKQVTSPEGSASAVIRDVDKSGERMTVDRSAGFKAGDDLTIHDVWTGDSVRIPGFLTATRTPDGTWKTNPTGHVSVSK